MRSRRIDLKLLLASLGIAVGLVAIVIGVRSSVTGREQQGLPVEIESVDPVRGATQVPQQTRVFVDLLATYEAVLVIDGVELPTVDLGSSTPTSTVDDGAQISLPPGALFEAGNATITFVPGASAHIERFEPGPHTAQVIYWKTIDGRDRSRSFTWDFYVV